ncbi:MAG: antibiotic biosynthesis monooxygenase [Chloroflexota bacterium]
MNLLETYLRPVVLGQIHKSVCSTFVVGTTWESKADFENWTQSEEFKKGHAQAGRLPNEAFLDHPKLEIFAVIQAAKRGGLG